jgi:hypothetical protein
MRTFRDPRSLTHALVVAWLLSYCQLIRADRYVEVTGKLELIRSLNDRSGVALEKRRTIPLKCVFGTNKWRIEEEYIINAKRFWFFDGTNVYERAEITKPATITDGIEISFAPFDVARSNVCISITPSQGGHPLGDIGPNIPWLAFCSGKYLKTPNRLVPLPTIDIRTDGLAFHFTDTVHTFQDELGLPKSIELFLRESKYQNRSEPVKPPLARFRYEAIETTNVAGWTVPTKITFTTFDLNPLLTGIGNILTIRECPEPENVFISGSDGLQTIVDRRFRDSAQTVSEIIYPATNLFAAPPLDDPMLQARFKNALKKAASLQGRRR